MLSIISLLVVVSLSFLITRVATEALAHTGLSHESARFQALTAFSGVGFTTAESEKVVNHPVRRRIIMGLMVFGNAGIVTVMSTLILTFVGDTDHEYLFLKIIFLFAGLGALFLISRSEWVNQKLSVGIDFLLNKYTDIDSKDYHGLLHLGMDYRVSELMINEEDWICGLTIKQSGLNKEGILILGIEKNGSEFVGVPRKDITIEKNDILILYGRNIGIKDLDRRKKGREGDKIHFQEKRIQKKLEEIQAEDYVKPKDAKAA